MGPYVLCCEAVGYHCYLVQALQSCSRKEARTFCTFRARWLKGISSSLSDVAGTGSEAIDCTLPFATSAICSGASAPSIDVTVAVSILLDVAQAVQIVQSRCSLSDHCRVLPPVCTSVNARHGGHEVCLYCNGLSSHCGVWTLVGPYKAKAEKKIVVYTGTALCNKDPQLGTSQSVSFHPQESQRCQGSRDAATCQLTTWRI